MLTALSRGFALGLKAECVIAQKLEQGWDRPLAEWRQQLRLSELFCLSRLVS